MTKPAPASELEASPPWVEPAPDRPLPFWASLRADLAAQFPPAERRLPRGRLVARCLYLIAFSDGLRATWSYRLAHSLRGHAGPLGKAAAGVLYWWVRLVYGCAISPAARLHGGLVLPHPIGIVIGPGAVVGPGTWIFQHATLGGAPGKAGLPVVGAGGRIFAGAVLAGPIRLGDDVLVGANAVVRRDVPSRHAVRAPEPDVAPLPARSPRPEEP